MTMLSVTSDMITQARTFNMTSTAEADDAANGSTTAAVTTPKPVEQAPRFRTILDPASPGVGMGPAGGMCGLSNQPATPGYARSRSRSVVPPGGTGTGGANGSSNAAAANRPGFTMPRGSRLQHPSAVAAAALDSSINALAYGPMTTGDHSPYHHRTDSSLAGTATFSAGGSHSLEQFAASAGADGISAGAGDDGTAGSGGYDAADSADNTGTSGSMDTSSGAVDLGATAGANRGLGLLGVPQLGDKDQHSWRQRLKGRTLSVSTSPVGSGTGSGANSNSLASTAPLNLGRSAGPMNAATARSPKGPDSVGARAASPSFCTPGARGLTSLATPSSPVPFGTLGLRPSSGAPPGRSSVLPPLSPMGTGGAQPHR